MGEALEDTSIGPHKESGPGGYGFQDYSSDLYGKNAAMAVESKIMHLISMGGMLQRLWRARLGI